MNGPAEAAAWLAELPRLPASATDAASGWQLVKRNAVRSVFRAVLPARLAEAAGAPGLFLKIYHDPSLRSRLRDWLRGSRARREWQAALYAERHGLGAIRAVAFSEAIGWGGGRAAALLTRSWEPAKALDEFWLELAGDAERRAAQADASALTERLAELLARAHQAGFEHVDLHPRNILVQRRRGVPVVALIDLAGARCGAALSDAALGRNLAQLNQWFRRHSSVAQRLRFLRAYLRWRNEFEVEYPTGRPLAGDLRDLVRRLEAAAARHQQKLWSKRDRRAEGDGRYFGRLRLAGGWRGLVLLEAKHRSPDSPVSERRLARADWLAALTPPERLLDPSRAAVCKESHSATVGRTRLSFAGGVLEVIVKRPLARNWRRRLRHLLGKSRSRRGWERGHLLLNRFQPAARPVAVLEKRLGPLVLDSLLLTEVVPDGLDLEAHLRREFGERSPRAWLGHKRVLAAVLARRLQGLRDAQVAHADCKAQNLLVRPGRTPRLIWIDMDGIVPLERSASVEEQVQALARLELSMEEIPGLTRVDRVRFLRSYAASFGAAEDAWRGWWRRVAPEVARQQAQRDRHRAWKLEHYGRA